LLDSQSAFWSLFKRRQRHQRKDVSINSVVAATATVATERQNGNGSTATEGCKPGMMARRFTQNRRLSCSTAYEQILYLDACSVFAMNERLKMHFCVFSQRVSIACYAKRCISYRKSVCLTVRHTLVSIQTTQATITGSSLEDSPMTRFLMVNFSTKFQRENGERGRQMIVGWEKLAIFSQ